jgi:hypothetical protein
MGHGAWCIVHWDGRMCMCYTNGPKRARNANDLVRELELGCWDARIAPRHRSTAAPQHRSTAAPPQHPPLSAVDYINWSHNNSGMISGMIPLSLHLHIVHVFKTWH